MLLCCLLIESRKFKNSVVSDSKINTMSEDFKLKKLA